MVSAAKFFLTFLLIISLWGCGAGRAYVPQVIEPYPPQREDVGPRGGVSKGGTAARKAPSPGGWSVRVFTQRELLRLGESDPELSPSTSMGILARLNTRARYYIAEDIQNGRPLKVPYDFKAFKNWSPLPARIPMLSSLPKFVLIIKDIPFLGWYGGGRLLKDTEICIGRQNSSTETGIYLVKEKDANHVSRSYTNAYGQPAPMPWALRIYDHVWIHTGDITSGYCSHGCINLPLMPSRELFQWADNGTVVMIIESLKDLPAVLARNSSNCLLFTEECVSVRQGEH